MTGRRRVLVELDNLELGGAQINAVQLSAGLTAAGYDSLLVGPRQTLPPVGPSVVDIAAEYGLPIRAYQRAESMSGRARQIARFAREWDADVVHAFSSSERAAYWGAAVLGRRGIVRTVYEMSFDPRSHRHSPLIVGTGYLRDALEGWPGGVHLISPPVDTVRDAPGVSDANTLRRSAGVAPDAIVLAIVSRLSSEMKAVGIECTMRAVARIQDPRVVLLVAGTGDAQERLRSLGERINDLLGRVAVRFMGPLSDPRPVYEAADIVLGMGGSAARGLAFGKPVVVLGERGWSDVFTPETAGEIFRSSFWSPLECTDGEEQLIRHLRDLTTRPEHRARLGAFGRSFAQEHFGLPAMAGRLAVVYEEAIRRASPWSWVRDLNIEARILLGRGQRSAMRLTGGAFRGVPSLRMEWAIPEATVSAGRRP
ncbi:MULTISPECIES: glycosyltransferase family 4 protein [unclassified Microbacterium]|uniref:glycosyltransferase family 4 protein n=1 Tax=unclassified Microbacterium TaxID=2609290 RepID=UPI00214A953A|nr:MULTISPECIES: glycosyltransferase family 4 protein [unclassified Microbacterium]MCR2784994.1 glycosyltransferase family 4 protein [Microbacterium sp. zg.B96]WIM16533.1 glycosyltransferase family 4 protein [Microbacterium sp. zg-B96]